MSRARGVRLQIVVVGKARPPHDAPARLYEDRAGALVAMRVDEVAAERVLDRVVSKAWLVAVDPAGKAPTSSATFAAWLERRLAAQRPVTFAIGGADGLDRDLVARADERLSLGPLTMPHQLARVVLAEQIYRSLCIMRGHPYAR